MLWSSTEPHVLWEFVTGWDWATVEKTAEALAAGNPIDEAWSWAVAHLIWHVFPSLLCCWAALSISVLFRG